MKKVKIKVKKLYEDVELPQYQHESDAGLDVRAYIDETDLYGSISGSHYIEIKPFQTKPIKTGLSFEIPDGYELQIRSRSGMSLVGLVVANSPGTIDSTFRGHVKVLINNTSNKILSVEHGMRIAQLVLKEQPQIEWEEIAELMKTERGENGFGSTGVK